MSAFSSSTSLIIHSIDPGWTPDNQEPLINLLQEKGFIDKSLNKNENSYLVGEKFLSHISFMGCSPNLKFEDESDDGKFTFVRFTSTSTVSAITGKHSFAPQCPQCKKTEKNWRALLKDNKLVCSHCLQTSDAWSYNWRKSAGFGRFFIEVTDIYPKEAIPQPALLYLLENEFNTSWCYFFNA